VGGSNCKNHDWKESWQNEHISIICGFANAGGGVLEIGRSENGEIQDIENLDRLKGVIPDKIRHYTGIVPEVDVLESEDGNYLTATVKSYHFPVSYKGKFYYYSQGMARELEDNELEVFLKPYANTWDYAAAHYAKISDLEKRALDAYRRFAFRRSRIKTWQVGRSNKLLLDLLHLRNGKNLKRAAVLLFYRAPEVVATGAYIKIELPDEPDDSLGNKEIRGPLITIVDRVEDLVYKQYLKYDLIWEGLTEIKNYLVPRQAFREALLNAVIHRDYTTDNPILIQIRKNSLLIQNDGVPLENRTNENLLSERVSLQRNPFIANAFLQMGEISAWGYGIEKILDSCKAFNKPEPFYDISSGKTTICFNFDSTAAKKLPVDFARLFTKFPVLSEVQQRILELMIQNPKVSIIQLAEDTKLTKGVIQTEIRRLRSSGLIEHLGERSGGYWEVNIE
jgi:ATP-dependent DNA helicase RecG